MVVKLIVAGSRHLDDMEIVTKELMRWWMDRREPIVEVVSGGAPGADTLGERVAERIGFPVKRFVAEWGRYGHRAGPIRNIEMADYADALLAFPIGVSSPGTRHMIQAAQLRHLDVTVVEVPSFGSMNTFPESKENS